MAIEKKIREVLDLITTAPPFEVEALSAAAKPHALGLRSIVDSPNIVAVGISEKVTGEQPTGILALTFYVEEKIALSELMADQAIPPTLPLVLSGKNAIPTDVVVLGKIQPEVNATHTPVQPGNSVGHFDIPAGTLGAIVTDGANYFALSNSHVLAKSGTAVKGDPVLYPGRQDGGIAPADILGQLHDFVPFVKGADFSNECDCAIAKILPEKITELIGQIKGVGFPKGVITPKRGMKLVKVGRSSDRTEGIIRDVDVRLPVPYEEEGVGEILFMNQVLCSRFTEPGDSGSLVLDQKSGKAVGLHFCGSPVGSIFNPIDKVLSALQVKLVTKKISVT